jgi:hypothetical protein
MPTPAEQAREEIKRLEELAAKKKELGRVELYLQSAMRGTNKLRKDTKGLDSALYQAATNLERRHYSLKKSSEELQLAHAKNKKLLTSLAKKTKDVEKAIADAIKNKDKQKVKELGEEYKIYSKRLKEVEKVEDKFKKDQEQLSSHIEDTRKKMYQVADALERMSDYSKVQIRTEDELKAAISERVSAINEEIKALVAKGELTQAQGKLVLQNMTSEKSMREMQSKLAAEASEELKRELAYREKIQKLDQSGRPEEKSEEIRGTYGRMAGAAKKLVGGGSLKERMGAAKDLKGSSKDWNILKETMGSVTKGATGLAGTMKLLGFAFSALGKLNVFALIITAIVTIAKTVNELDKFIKSYNKSFAKMYGPTVAIKNVRESMRSFTDAVFDMNRNLKYGLKSEEIMGLFDALSAGGMSLQGVGRRVKGGYNEVIVEAAKLSTDFGVSLEDMGGMIAEQMVDLRSSLDEVSGAMKQMAYDASVAGIKSQKFYEATMAAAGTLSFYGSRVKDASAMLRDFLKSGTMGMKDASAQVQELTGLFKNMSFEQRMGVMAMTGGAEKWEKRYRAVADEMRTEEKTLAESIKYAEEAAAGMTDETKKRKKLEDIQAMKAKMEDKRKMRVMAETAIQGGEMSMARMLPTLSEEVPGTLLDIVKDMSNIDIWDAKDIQATLLTLEKTTGLSADAFDRMIIDMRKGVEDAKAASDYLSQSFSKVDMGVKKEVSKLVGSYLDVARSGGVVDMDKMRSELGKFSGKLGMDVDKFMELFQDNARVVESFLKGTTMTEQTFRKIVEENVRKPLEINMGMGVEERDKRIDDMVKNTRTIEDFVGISKENAKYLGARSDLQQMASMAAIEGTRKLGGIFAILQKWFYKNEMTDEEFKASDKWDSLIKLSEKQALLTYKLNKAQEDGNKAQEDLLTKQIAAVEEEKKRVAGGKEELIPEAAMTGEQRAAENLKERASLISQIQTEKGKENVDEGKLNELQKKIRDTYAVETFTAPEEMGWLDTLIYDIVRNPGKYVKNSALTLGTVGGLASAPAIATADITKNMMKKDKAPEQVKDFLAESGGYVNVSKGDLVVDSNSLAKGMAKEKGMLAGTLINKMGGFEGTTVTVPISLQIGSVNGDVDDLVKKITPAIEQSFNRMFFEQQKRK